MKKEFVKTYYQFLNEDSVKSSPEVYTPYVGKFIETSHIPRWKNTPQLIANRKSSVKLAILNYIFESELEGRSYSEILRFYYNLRDMKSNMYTEYTRRPDGSYDSSRKEKGEFNSKRDRGLGSTMFIGREYWGKPTGILIAHCKKGQSGKWVLTDTKLRNVFNELKFKEIGATDDDIELMKDLGIF